MFGDCNNAAELHEVEVDQRALVNILSRYPGTFDVLRELIQNADDADARSIEIHFQTGESEKFQPTSNLDVSNIKVRKWIIKNNGSGFEEKDWKRLGRIAAGNDNSTKVGAFGVGFYSVLSKSNRPLVKSNGKSLQFERGKGGKLCKRFVDCSSDAWTSVELELREPEGLPVLADLTKFLVSSVAFLTNVDAISVHLDRQRVLHIHKQIQSPVVDISIPQHLKPTTPSHALTVECVQRIVQRIAVDAEEWVFPLSSTSSSPVVDTEALVERPGRSKEDHLTRTSRSVDAIPDGHAIAYDLYMATTRVNLDEHSEVKKGVESNMKSLPSSFTCKAVYFNSEQCLASVNHSQSPKAKQLAHRFCGSQGIFPENDSGRLFIGQSTNQTTGIGLHISAHFLPTMERGAIDLANGQVKAWNKEVLWAGGFLARIIYEEEMNAAKSKANRAKQLGLCTMDRFAFAPTAPHSGVSQILQEAFFCCSHESKSPLPVVSDSGISCVLKNPFRQSNKDLSFLKRYPVLHEGVEPRQRSQIISQYEIPGFKFHDIVQEFKDGATQDAMRAFFRWWHGVKKNLHSSSSTKEFCKKFATHAVVHSSHGVKIALVNIKYFTFFPLPSDLSHPNNIYVDVTQDVPSRDAVECFGWAQLSLLDWLEHVCSQARRCALNKASDRDSDVGYRILRVLVQFALVEDLSPQQWDWAAELMKDLKCIPTNMGLEFPAHSYFDLADICGSLPVAKEVDFLNIPPTPIAVMRGFETRFVDQGHVRKVLARIRVRGMMDWEYTVGRLESGASEESNFRFLRYLAIICRVNLWIDHHQLDALKWKKVFHSEIHGRASAAELLLPSEDVRKLGLPILALRRNGITSLQSDVDPSGSFAVEPFVQLLGMRKYPTLDKIIAQAASDSSEVRRPALQYLLSNLETLYKAYNSDNYAEVAFIPTNRESLARPNEVFASPVWEKLGFNKISEDLRRDFSRLGVKEDPSADMIMERFKTPERTLPNLNTAVIWFESLYLHGKLPIPKLREELSITPFVPVKNPGPGSSDSSSIQYFCPKNCFITSAETKTHYRRIFTFVNFGQNGNNFLESCCAKKSPDASDILRKILQDPQGYLKALGNITLYLEDLRTIASQLDSISEEDKQAMKEAPMFPAERNGVVAQTLLPAEQVFISDWVGRDFGGNVSVAPKDDKLEKMYREMGSAFLGTRVRHVVTVGDAAPCDPLFHHDKVILCIRYFMEQRDKNGRTNVSFDDQDSTNKLRVKVSKNLTLKKTFAPPYDVLADAAAAGPVETDAVQVKAGFEFDEDDESYILWMVSCPRESVELRNDIAVALCHVLLKTYGPNDVLLLASLFAMSDKSLKGYYDIAIRSELPGALNGKAKPTDRSNNKFEFHLPLSPYLANLVGARKTWSRRTVGGKQTISAEEDMKRAIALWGESDLSGEILDSSAPNQLYPNGHKKRDNHCKQAYTIRLREKKNLQDKGTKIRFFLAWGVQCQQPPQSALEEFARLISRLADVFGREASTACYIFWKDTAEDLMAFNRDQKYIFLNLANYHRFYYNKGVDKKKLITDWYLIMAHEIAHNLTMEHDEYHGSLSASLAIKFLPGLHKKFDDVSWENVQQQPQGI